MEDDMFLKADMDIVQYINTKFPTEDSLCNLDYEIEKLQSQLTSLNKELQTEIHEHALMNQHLKEEVEKANSTTKEILLEVKEIKFKAEHSEKLVNQMCGDIKNLDIAKKNLTFSITSLKKYIMMLTAIDKLREYCANRDYKEVTDLLFAFHDLS